MSNVNNGRRAEVEHPLFAGTAGLVETEGQVQISFPFKGNSLPDGGLTIDGSAYRIDAARKSLTAPGMVVLTLSAVTGDTPQP
jgi:hypothetical protein